jgi:uncharacterized membrane protein YfcA
MSGLAILFGSCVGFALGLTGGGGGVFAVPMLVYGMGVAPREAVGISLAAVGGTAMAGVLPHLWRGQVELRTGLIFAIAGMLGAPLGSYVSTLIPETVLLLIFGCLMLVVAWRMWAKSNNPNLASGVCPTEGRANAQQRTCERDATGKLRLTSKCTGLLVMIGFFTGILSGMFGVGGGFIIVPALVLFSGMKIHQAVGTSLLVIVLISASGVASYLLADRQLSLDTTSLFLIGGLLGIGVGGWVSTKLNGPTLQKVFAIAVVLVAIFMIVKTTYSVS